MNSPIVGGLILLSIMPFLFGLTINTLLPAFSTDVLQGGPDDLGFLMTGMGVGAILGSLVLAKMGHVHSKGYWLIATGALWGVMSHCSRCQRRLSPQHCALRSSVLSLR